MTVAEFKQNYPEYSHLEGDELWDKMTDMVCLTGSVYTADPDREIHYNSYHVDGIGEVSIEDSSKTVWINERGEKGYLKEKPFEGKPLTIYGFAIFDGENWETIKYEE